MGDKEVIYSRRSALNLIKVVKPTKLGLEGKVELYLNNEPYCYSFDPSGDFPRRHILNICCVVPLMDSIQKVLLLGLGPGAMLTRMGYFYKNLIFDAVEIDPEIVEVGYKYFGLKKSPHLNVFIGDARKFLESTDNFYDLVIIDVFKEGRTPCHLCTYEFFKLVYNRLNKKGILFMNLTFDAIYRCDRPSIGKTASKIFPSIFRIPWPILLATKKKTFLWRLKMRLKKNKGHPALEGIKKWTIPQIKKFKFGIKDKIFLDKKD